MALAGIDKVLVSNRTGLVAKYGASGATAVYAAITRLVQADNQRHIATAVVDIDDGPQMAAFGCSPVINVSDQRGAKEAVDAIATKLVPDFILLLDGPDVIPHIALNQISGLSDGDLSTDSDLPYACQAAFSQVASNYLAVTRVVSRLPMVLGNPDVGLLVSLIDKAAAHQPKRSSDYNAYFSISALPWQQSTQLSLRTAFGNHNALQLSPNAGHAAIDPKLKALTHFINCHGATADCRFYGQQGSSYPIAMESALVQPHVLPGTIAVAECCYGAELYDPALLAIAPPISAAYMTAGAICFLGSTNIAYGSPTTNTQADLLVRFFVEALLKGASTGRAFLQARQQFISSQIMAAPANLKTLAQFVLFGDPSLAPIAAADLVQTAQQSVSAEAAVQDGESSRKARRISLRGRGLAVASSSTFTSGRTKLSAKVMLRISDIAKARGFSAAPVVLAVSGGPGYRTAAKTVNMRRMVATVVEKCPDHNDPKTGVRFPRFRVLTAHILGDGVTAVEECESR